MGLPCDVCDPDSLAWAVAEGARSLGGLNSLVYTPAYVPLLWLGEATPLEWRRVFETNVVGACEAVRRALPALQQSRGRVLFVSSDWLRYPRAALSLYGTSKAALDAACVGFRIEVPEVSFTTVVLGPTVPTDISREWDFDKAGPIMQTWEAKGINYRGFMDVEDTASEMLRVLTSPVRIDEIVLEPPEGGPH